MFSDQPESTRMYAAASSHACCRHGFSAVPANVDVWTFPLELPDVNLEGLEAILDEFEVARARRLVTMALREKYMLAHVALRRVLASYLGNAPEDIVWEYGECPMCGGPHGKPSALQVCAEPIHFSLAHCRKLAVVAVARVEVGIDVETVRSLRELDRLKTWILSPVEVGYRGDQAASATLLEAFVYKEAVLKAAGVGLAADPREVELAAGMASAAFRGQRYGLCTVDLDDTVCAAAVAGREVRIRTRIMV